jgi:hypothetical protein
MWLDFLIFKLKLGGFDWWAKMGSAGWTGHRCGEQNSNCADLLYLVGHGVYNKATVWREERTTEVSFDDV